MDVALSTNQLCLLLLIPPAVPGSTHHLPYACMDLLCPVQANPVQCSSTATILLSSSKSVTSNGRTLNLPKPSAAPATQTTVLLKSRILSNFESNMVMIDSFDGILHEG